MRQNREKVLRWMNISEGGYVNHPDDPGGATNMGVTQRTYDAFRSSQGLPKRPVRQLSRAEADEIFSKQYMDPVSFDELPSGLDYAMADYSVNSGPAKAIKDLQRVLGVSADGVMGKITLTALAERNVEDVIVDLCSGRMKFLRGLKTWKTFGKGWSARVEGAKAGVQTDDIGVVDRAVMLARQEADIPAPVRIKDVGKGVSEDVGAKVVLASMLKEPATLVPALGAVGPLLTGQGPVQIALAVAIVGVTALFIFKILKRERQNA